MSNELAVIETEGEAADLTRFDPRPSAYVESVKAETFAEYLVPISFGGRKQTDLSAYGIEHLAAELGISIVDQEWTESDTHYFMKSTAECCHTQRKSVATVSQPKQIRINGKITDDPNALEKASRRGNRNALRQMIPTQLLKKLIEAAIKDGKAKQSAIAEAQSRCTEAYDANKEQLGIQGLTKQAVFKVAQTAWGESDTWTVDDWETLADAMNDPENFDTYFNGV